MSEKASLNLTAEQLQTLISTAVATAVAEARKPLAPTPEEQAALDQAKQMRQERGEQELAIQANRRREQKYCSHRHSNGQGAVVPVGYTNDGIRYDFLICVHCQGKIKPAPSQHDDKEQFIYDENLYWTLFSSRQQTTF